MSEKGRSKNECISNNHYTIHNILLLISKCELVCSIFSSNAEMGFPPNGKVLQLNGLNHCGYPLSLEM